MSKPPKGLRRLLASKRKRTKKTPLGQTLLKGLKAATKGRAAKKRHSRRFPPAALRVGSKAWSKRMAELGLPTPSTLKGPAPRNKQKAGTPDDPRFQRLQKQWYAKLAKDGFDDIEWIDHNTGHGQNSSYLKRNHSRARPTQLRNHALQEFFRLAGIYGNHATFDVKWDKEIWELFAEGVTYRNILRQLRAKGMRKSLYWIWARIDAHIQLLQPWHDTHPEGLYSPVAYEEPYVADVLLNDQTLQQPKKLSMQ